jgi:TolA-binding protein
LNETGNAKDAIQAMNRIIKSYPDDPLVPMVCFRAAQILHGRMMNTPRAKKVLTGLMKKYPDHDIIPHVKTYLAQMG